MCECDQCVCVCVCVCVCEKKSERPSLITICPCIANIRRCVCVCVSEQTAWEREWERRRAGRRECVCITHPWFSSQDEGKTWFIHLPAGRFWSLSLPLSGSDCLSCLAHTNIHSLSLPCCFCASLTSHSISLFDTHTHTHTSLLHWPLGGGVANGGGMRKEIIRWGDEGGVIGESVMWAGWRANWANDDGKVN